MDDSNRTKETAPTAISDLVGLIKSWIPWRSEPSHVSRDFWMPDRSCRVCYECDSHFNFFNRRHHCRLCGRIFCSKCTSHCIPAPSDTPQQQWDTAVRVCDYCHKQWQLAPVENGVPVAATDLDPHIFSTSPSASFVSVKSSDTSDSSNCTFLSLPNSSVQSPCKIVNMETSSEMQSNPGTLSNDHTMDDWSQGQDGLFQNRTEYDGKEFGLSHFGSSRSPLSEVYGYFDHVQYDDMGSEYKSRKVHPDGDAVHEQTNTSSLYSGFNSQASTVNQQLGQKDFEHSTSDECEAPSSLYVAEDVDAEPVDFESNALLWLPPEPEDEEDDREPIFIEDDDDGIENAAGEWGYLRNSSSFGSGVYRSRDKSNDEHKRAMKNVLDSHFRALVTQLLQVENISAGDENDQEGWLEIITALSWEAATMLKPDMSTGGQMDPGGYVKVKCLASGRRSQSMVVRGIVCKKNVAHRRMTSKFQKARLLILGGALEYQRVSTALSSIETLLQQEMDHLKMAVAKIEAHRPDVLLVEKSVSRYAQEYLLEKDISLVLNIKRPLLERIARCSGGQIVPSIDQLSSKKLGYCDEFHVERFLEEHGSAGQEGKKLTKTLMYFEGCPKPLGCTILLRGASGDELKKVKHVVQYGVFAAYHLALETSFLADEGATLPVLPLETPFTVALPDKSSYMDRSISTVPGFTVPEYTNSSGHQPIGEPQRLSSEPTSDLAEAINVAVGENKYERSPELPDIMSSPYVPPLYQSKDEGVQPSMLNDLSGDLSLADFSASLGTGSETGRLAAEGVSRIINDFRAVQSEIMDSDANQNILNLSSDQKNEKQIPEEQPTVKEEFLPPSSDNQSILVSLSSRCVWKGTVCERSHLFRIKYYSNSDKPLGRFLRDDLFDQNYRCRSCEMPAEAHIQCYTHRQGTLTISVRKMSEILLPGEKDGKIWMWHRCLKCPRDNGFPPATRRIVMSDAAWGLSFGKFLELSFSNHAAASRVACCGHSLHRDCLRFYGFGRMVACFRYASIDVHSVYLPPAKLDFNFESQEWIEKELNEVATRGDLLFAEVLNVLSRLASRKSDSSLPSCGFVPHLPKMEVLLQKEKSEFEESVQKILNNGPGKGEPTYDILEINRLQRQLVFQAYVWDQRLLDVEREANTKQALVAPTEKPFNIPVVTDSGELLNNSPNISADGKPDHPDGQVAVCLSDGPDAASSGESHLGVVTIKNSNASEQLELDSLSTGGSVKSDVEDSGEGQTVSKDTPSLPVLTSKGSETMEDNTSWLGMSFMNFYRSLNNNFLGSAQKLDKFRDYKPVHIFQELELQGGARFLLPVGVNDTVVPVYDDEPTSIISYVLLSPDYHAQVSEKVEKLKEAADPILSMQSSHSSSFQLFHSFDETVLESYKTIGSGDEPMSSSTISHSSLPSDAVPPNLHPRVSFMDDGPLGKVKYTVTCYYAKEFESLRKMCCPSEIDFVRSLSRCKKWGAQGGKSNVFFAKTLDDRFIIKQVTKTELESFIKFGARYFKYLTESISTGSPTCLAKILGIYQVASKHLKGGKEVKMDLLVMENLLFRRNVTRLYDLKGSVRSRYNPDSTGSNKVLLDQNLIEAMPTSPIFVGNKAKRLLERAVWNDTAFLALIDVMDYSLLVGVDEEKNELVLGIIDFMRQYTWDKHLETWVKASGILGGSNALPTVISPKQYKTRFRKAMTTYFLMVPDQWSPATIVPSKSQTDLLEGNSVQSVTTSGE